MTQNTLARWDVLLGGSLIFAAGLALCLSLCSSLVIGAENRYVLAGVVALPLVLPLVFCGVGVLKFAFGDGSWGATSRNFIVLIGYSIGLAGLGPVLADAVWGNRRDPSPQQSPPYNGDEK
jgi:ABC-type transport system involved in cytochrome c biogenesis permease component